MIGVEVNGDNARRVASRTILNKGGCRMTDIKR
jgi:hypothetical protein